MSESPLDPPPKEKPPARPIVRVPVGQRPVRRPIVTPDSSKRDTLIAIACGGGVLLLVVLGNFALSGQPGKPSANHLTGVITAKHDSGEVEKEISIGKKGLKSQETDSGFSFTVHVEAENRDYEVPVNEGRFRAKKVGDTQDFIRPLSEQR